MAEPAVQWLPESAEGSMMDNQNLGTPQFGTPPPVLGGLQVW